MTYEEMVSPSRYREIRKMDQPFLVTNSAMDFQVGDRIIFKEWYGKALGFSGRECSRRITCVYEDTHYLKEGCKVLGLEVFSKSEKMTIEIERGPLHVD